MILINKWLISWLKVVNKLVDKLVDIWPLPFFVTEMFENSRIFDGGLMPDFVPQVSRSWLQASNHHRLTSLLAIHQAVWGEQLASHIKNDQNWYFRSKRSLVQGCLFSRKGRATGRVPTALRCSLICSALPCPSASSSGCPHFSMTPIRAIAEGDVQKMQPQLL